MGGRKDGESQIGNNPVSLELHKIYNLNPVTALIGFGQIIDERRMPLLAKDNLTPTENFIFEAYSAVASILDTDKHPEYLTGKGDYKKAVESAVRYMKFLGVSEDDLSAKGIISAYQRTNDQLDPDKQRELEEETGVVDIFSRMPFKCEDRAIMTPREKRLSEENERLRKKIDELLGIDLQREDTEMLEWLDFLMATCDSVPSKEKQDAGSRRLTEALLKPEKPRKKKRS